MPEAGTPIHGTSVLIVEPGRWTLSDYDGFFEFGSEPAATNPVITRLDRFPAEVAKTNTISKDEGSELEFPLSLSADRFEMTTTAPAKEETFLEAFQDVETLDTYDPAETNAVSLREAPGHRVGNGHRSAQLRPKQRSADHPRHRQEQRAGRGRLAAHGNAVVPVRSHGEVVGVAQTERLEVLNGPSTLLLPPRAAR